MSELQRDIAEIEAALEKAHSYQREDWKRREAAWQRLKARLTPDREAEDDASEESQFLNHYRCPSCQHEWDSQWSATCDDECPNCGASNISPWRSEDL